MERQSIAVVGAGDVGATAVYALIMAELPIDILLIDVDQNRCQGQVLDLQDTLALKGAISTVSQADLCDARSADIIVIAAGARQKPEEKREELLRTNCAVISVIFDGIGTIKQETIVIMVSNPVDVLAWHAMHYAGLSSQQIISTGTFLDTKRLVRMISNKLAVSEESVHVTIVGEHGDSQVPVWSQARIGDLPLSHFCTQVECEEFGRLTRERAYEIIQSKGATYFGIGACIAELCVTILQDKKTVIPVSSYHQEYGVFLSMPSILGSNGIEQIFSFDFSPEEHQKFLASVQILKKLSAKL